MFITGNNLAILYSLLYLLFESARVGIPTLLPSISATAGALLVTAIWQGAVVAACLALSMRLTDRISARLRFTLWVAGFFAVAGLPFLPLILNTFARAALPTSLSSASAPRFSLDFRWSVAIVLLWVAVSVYRAIDLAMHTVRLRSLWLTARQIQNVKPLASLRGRRPIQICTTDALDRPSVIGFFAPRILIPTWLLPSLTSGELDQILLHETEHLRRGDDWINLLQKLSLILFPLNPVLLWMERQLCIEREMACDEAVIRVTHAPRAYAACLTTLAERGIEYRSQASESLSLGAWRRRPELVHRVHTLLNLKPTLGLCGARCFTAALSCGLIFGSVELARCPQLVGFVPAHAESEARLSQPEPKTSLGSTHAVFASWQQENPERSIRPRMIETRATVKPILNPGALSGELTQLSPRKLASQPSPRMNKPQQVLLKAEAPAAEQTSPEGWLVMTTWEEVAVASPTADPSPVSTESASAEPNHVQAIPPVSSQLRVTRMVFRVVPASFVSPSPTAVRTQDGWLVIQM